MIAEKQFALNSDEANSLYKVLNGVIRLQIFNLNAPVNSIVPDCAEALKAHMMGRVLKQAFAFCFLIAPSCHWRVDTKNMSN